MMIMKAYPEFCTTDGLKRETSAFEPLFAGMRRAQNFVHGITPMVSGPFCYYFNLEQPCMAQTDVSCEIGAKFRIYYLIETY